MKNILMCFPIRIDYGKRFISNTVQGTPNDERFSQKNSFRTAIYVIHVIPDFADATT